MGDFRFLVYLVLRTKEDIMGRSCLSVYPSILPTSYPGFCNADSHQKLINLILVHIVPVYPPLYTITLKLLKSGEFLQNASL
jgi:hypothetical protein